jgi:hypothetical protein
MSPGVAERANRLPEQASLVDGINPAAISSP